MLLLIVLILLAILIKAVVDATKM